MRQNPLKKIVELQKQGKNVGIYSVCSANGYVTAAALISCLFTELFRVQALLFIVVSVLCLLAFRPLAAKLRKTHTATNGDRNLGREATVLTPVTAEEPGRVRLDGVDWNARCVTPGDILNPGDHCRVTEIHSTLLLVEPILTESRKA